MRLVTAILFAGGIGLANALGQNLTISFTPSYSALELSGGQIVVSANDHWGVIKAAGDLATDFGRITGKNLTLYGAGATTSAPVYTWHAPTSNTTYAAGPAQQIIGPSYTSTKLSKTVIIVGTIGQSTVIDSIISKKKIDISQTKGKWESFHSEVIKDPIDGVASALVIAGSDHRGTIYGVCYFRACFIIKALLTLMRSTTFPNKLEYLLGISGPMYHLKCRRQFMHFL
jgi:hypothetical protein